jgi:hypothetical protein
MIEAEAPKKTEDEPADGEKKHRGGETAAQKETVRHRRRTEPTRNQNSSKGGTGRQPEKR